MTVFSLNNLDDEIMSITQNDFAGGQNSNVSPTLLADNQSQLLIDADIGENGKLLSRSDIYTLGKPADGTVQGLAWFDNLSDQQILAVVDNRLWVTIGNGNWSLIDGYDTNGSPRVTIVQANNKLYISDGIQNQYTWDGGTLTELTGDNAPPKATHLLWVRHRMFAVGMSDNPYTIAVSDIDNPSYYSLDNSFDLNSGSGNPIIGLDIWQGNEIIFFNANGGDRVIADPSTELKNWEILALPNDQGLVAPDATAKTGNDLAFLSRDGLSSIGFNIANDQIGVTAQISAPVNDIIKRINPQYIDKVSMITFLNKTFISLPLDNATYNNSTLIYDNRLRQWIGIWSIEANCFSIGYLDSKRQLIWGDNEGNINAWDNSTTSDSLQTEWISKSWQFGATDNTKQGDYIILEFIKSTAEIELYLIIDEGDPVLFWSGSTTDGLVTLPLTLPFTLERPKNKRIVMDILDQGDFLSLALQIKVLSGSLSLRRVSIGAYINTTEDANIIEDANES